jgi:hypothetical protein
VDLPYRRSSVLGSPFCGATAGRRETCESAWRALLTGQWLDGSCRHRLLGRCDGECHRKNSHACKSCVIASVYQPSEPRQSSARAIRRAPPARHYLFAYPTAGPLGTKGLPASCQFVAIGAGTSLGRIPVRMMTSLHERGSLIVTSNKSFRAVRHVRSPAHRQLVEGAQRALRLLALSASVSCGERRQG